MHGIFHIRSVSVGLDSQIWYLFIYITGYFNVRKISETIDFRPLVGPLIFSLNSNKTFLKNFMSKCYMLRSFDGCTTLLHLKYLLSS